jgi:hypothetical protein
VGAKQGPVDLTQMPEMRAIDHVGRGTGVIDRAHEQERERADAKQHQRDLDEQ